MKNLKPHEKIKQINRIEMEEENDMAHTESRMR